LSAYCLQKRLDLPYRLWLLLRPAYKGRGWLDLSDILDLSIGNRRQTRAWLRAGEGTFWTKAGDRYYLAGLGSVSANLGVKPRKKPVAIPREAIEKLATFRATLFATWFADVGEKGREITQGTLSKIFGRTSRTLRTWAHLSGLEVRGNLAQAPIPEPGDDLEHYPTGTKEAMGWGKSWLDDPHDKPNLVWFERQDDKLVLTWKIANTYAITTLAVGPKTTLQRKASRHALDSEAARANDRMYFDKDADGRSLARAIQKGGPVYLEMGVLHEKTGEGLWDRLA